MSFRFINSLITLLVSANLAMAFAECYDVFIIAGQSNMDGRGEAGDLTGKFARLAVEQPDVSICYANPVNSPDPKNPVYRTGWQHLIPGLAVPPKYTNSLPSTRFGPELSFGRKWMDGHPGSRLALIKVTQGNTSLSKDWNPASQSLYLTLTNTVLHALKDLATSNSNVALKGFLWHQGESDVKAGAENYKKNLTAFISSVRHDLGMPELPFIIGEIATNKEPAFRAAQQTVAAEVSHAAFVSADGLTTVEGTHFDSPSVIVLGERFATAASVVFKAGAAATDRLIASELPVYNSTSKPVTPLTKTTL